jgi:hypothetical protein
MSESHLPDDPQQWPDNSFELLGVHPGMSERDVRRAYTRLIRTYKPEQYPEQFRRIREAYEEVLRYVELFRSYEENAPATLPEPEASPPPINDPVAELPLEEVATEAPPPEPDFSFLSLDAPFPPPPTPAQEPELLRAPRTHRGEPWELVLAGRPEQAYRRLIERSQQHAGSTEVYLQLYWLLRLTPGLDPRRSPCDHLVEGLLATGLAGPLRELYRREIVATPEEALGERFARLLEARATPAQRVELLEWRWQAAMRLRRWTVLSIDLPAQREQIVREDEAGWMRLLFRLLDELSWSREAPARKLREDCLQELKAHEHLALTLSNDFDRLDLLTSLVGSWHALCAHGGIPPALLELIPLSWTQPIAEIRGRLMELLQQVSAAPRQWLNLFDRVQAHGPFVLVQLGQLLDEGEERSENVASDRRTAADVSGLVRDFFDGLGQTSYEQARTPLLDFCLYEMLSPELVAEAAGERVMQGVIVQQKLASDWPLRYVYRACRLFWA